MRLFLFSLLLASAANAQLAFAPVASGFERPVQVVSAHDGTGDLYIVQQDGRIFRFDGLRSSLWIDLRPIVQCCDNGGLLSLVFHPTNGMLFVQYVNRDGDTAIARYQGNDAATAKVLLVAPQAKDNVPNHHGGTLQFGPDGYLWASIGDGGAFLKVTNRAQELDHLLGKLLRLDLDGNAAPGNPYGRIWSYGLRNPWRFSFDRVTGELLIGDVGQDAYEEINVLTIDAARGANFGWPIAEGKHCFPETTPCDFAGLTLPLYEYPRAEGCSVTGGYRYRGTRSVRFRGAYLYGDFCSGRIFADGRELVKTSMTIVSFGEDDDGELYVVDYGGTVYRIVDPPSPRVRVSRPASPSR